MKCLVTGCAGFIGSHLADFLIERGHQVMGMDNLASGDYKRVNTQVAFLQTDIRKPDISPMLSGIDWVFHCAALVSNPWCLANPGLTHDTNVSGTLNLLFACQEQKVKKFIYSSTAAVYEPKTPYAISKKSAEMYVGMFNEFYGVPTISLRYSNVYGSLRNIYGSELSCIASFYKSFHDKELVTIDGDGKQTRDFIHVVDVCKANLLAAESDKHGEYDICTGKQTSINDVAKYFNCPIIHTSSRRLGDVDKIEQNPNPAYADLVFRYETELSDGIKAYL